MITQVKSLVIISQEILTKNIDGLSYVGNVPYSLLKPSLKKATPQQLYYIERLNPHITPESDELWLRHMSVFKDLLDDYHQGKYQDASTWRGLYLKRYQENEKRKKIISEKVKSQYSKIQHEKAARSIKVLQGVVRGRTYKDPRRLSSPSSLTNSNSSRLFQETKKAAIKTSAIYRSNVQKSYHLPESSTSPLHLQHRRMTTVPLSDSVLSISKPPSQLVKSYYANYAKYGVPPSSGKQSASSLASTSLLIPPPPSTATAALTQSYIKSNCTTKISPSAIATATTHGSRERLKRQKTTVSKQKPFTTHSGQPKKPAALVNYNIFEELR